MRYIIFFLLFICQHAYSQKFNQLKIDESANGVPLVTFLENLEDDFGFDIIFDNKELYGLTISGVREEQFLNNFLELFLQPVKMSIVGPADNILLIIHNEQRNTYGKKKNNYLIFKRSSSGVNKLKGFIYDDENGEPLVGAQVYVKGTGIGSMTDINGYVELIVPTNINEIEIRYIGYETYSYIAAFSQLGNLEDINFSIQPKPVQLGGVTIYSEKQDQNIENVIAGVEKLGIEEIKTLPTFMGEIDPVKSISTLPGVSTVGEFSSGFNVRGGETGQNLIVQDRAIIYNPTHLFGFFSAFHPDMVKDIALFKGGGPATYGGRVSSTLEVNLKNGNASKYIVTGGIGVTSSRLSLEGPIVKDKTSFFIGGRISYVNWLLKSAKNLDIKNSSADFHDVTVKILHTIDDKNFISLTGYRSFDSFNMASDSTISWGTTNGTIRWDHRFNDELLSTLSFSSSNYLSEIHNEKPVSEFIYSNSIHNQWVKYDFVLDKDNLLNANFGIDINHTTIETGKLTPIAENSNYKAENMENHYLLESALYFHNEFEITDKLTISAGLRYSYFARLGAGKIYEFDFENMNGRYPSIEDSIEYDRGDIISTYNNLEPRLSARYLLNKKTSVKLSYNRSTQYVHLISNTTSVTPQDYYIGSGPHLLPSIGDQFSFGIFKNLEDNNFELSAETFYKKITNSIDYIDGAELTLNKSLEAGLLSGRGFAYGLEILIKKNKGDLNGWLSYTFSRSLRRFKDTNNMEINEGLYYPTAFDQPHNLSVVLNYRLGKKSFLSTNFTYNTGRPITIPVSKFSYGGYMSVLNFSHRNEYRIPDYHRLDLSITFENLQKKNAKVKSDLVFSIFNVYSRNNAYSIYFDKYGLAKKLSVLGSAFPSVTYNFTF